jgi:RNA 2',3'-cyclic 3'-phosphodiesterase
MTGEVADGKRLFLGVRVSVATANALAQCAEQLARRAKDAGLDVKWVAPTSYHVTLKFLGWTHDAAIAAVRDVATTALAGVTPFRFRTARLGAFPSLENASVVWAGVEDTGLGALATRLEQAMVGIGFAAESRPFTPHVTLGRLRQTRPVRDAVLPMSEQMFSDTKVDSVILFETETKPTGSVHKEIAKIDFNRVVLAVAAAEKRQTGALELGDEPHDLETDDGWPRGGRGDQ